MRLIFDDHTDLAFWALGYNRDQTESVDEINQRERGMTDAFDRACAANSLPEMRRAAVACCQATVVVRANRQVHPVGRVELDYGTQEMAYAAAQGQLAYYRVLEQQGQMRIIRTAGDLNAHWRTWQSEDRDDLPVGYLLAMEGADPIVKPSQVEAWWDDGLRCVMLAHFGESHYADDTGSEGPLASKGVQLLKKYEQLGMMLDLTHLGDVSFYEALDSFNGPVLASHTNCRALVAGDRQFSDEQIKLLINRGGIIGAVLDAWMLVPGWVYGKSTPENLKLTAVVDHIQHVCHLAGDSLHAAIGSDMGGTNHMPSDLKTTVDLQKLAVILAARGYSELDIDNIFHVNWLRFFRQWLPA